MIRDAAAALVVTVVVLLIAEAGIRVFDRARFGHWTHTSIVTFLDGMREVTHIYREHPFLNVGPNEGTHTAPFGRPISFNSLGYRSPERPLAKPQGTIRIICSGGSTTLDLLAADDGTWPSRLEAELRRRGLRVEVWNAGFPGWSSVENVISLAIRDVDLAPDIVTLLQGFNDLQPATQAPFNRQYEGFHTRAMRATNGIDMPRVPWYQHSLLLERVRTFVLGPQPLVATLPGQTDIVMRDSIPDEAVRVFERNIRSFIALARAHGASVVLVTQPVRLRAASAEADARWLEPWIPGLRGNRLPGELERLNNVLRDLASDEVSVADAARDIAWTDDDFGDPVHYRPSGSSKLALFIADRVDTMARRGRDRSAEQ